MIMNVLDLLCNYNLRYKYHIVFNIKNAFELIFKVLNKKMSLAFALALRPRLQDPSVFRCAFYILKLRRNKPYVEVSSWSDTCNISLFFCFELFPSLSSFTVLFYILSLFFCALPLVQHLQNNKIFKKKRARKYYLTTHNNAKDLIHNMKLAT